MEDLRGLYSHIAGTVHRMAPFFICLTQESIIGTTGITAPVTAALSKQASTTSGETKGRTPSCTATKLRPLSSSPFRRLSAKSQSNPFLTEKKRVSPLSRSHAGPCSRFPCKAYSNTADDPPEAQGLYVRKHPNDEKPLTYASKEVSA